MSSKSFESSEIYVCCLCKPVICFLIQLLNLFVPALFSFSTIFSSFFTPPAGASNSDQEEKEIKIVAIVTIIFVGLYLVFLFLQFSTGWMIQFSLRFSEKVKLVDHQFSVAHIILERRMSMCQIVAYFFCHQNVSLSSATNRNDGGNNSNVSDWEQLNILAYFRRATFSISLFNFLCIVPVAVYFWKLPNLTNLISVASYLFFFILYSRGPFYQNSTTISPTMSPSLV